MTDSTRGQTAETCVPVYEEPDHKLCLSNEYVYAYQVVLAPAQVTLWHRHSEDTVYFAMVAARAREVMPDRDAVVTDVPCGAAISRAHREQPLVHQVTNAGNERFHMIGAEAHARPPLRRDAPLSAPGLELVFESDRFRTYRIRQPALASSVDNDRYGLLVALDKARVAHPQRTHEVAFGDVLWLAPGRLDFPNGFSGFLAEWC